MSELRSSAEFVNSLLGDVEALIHSSRSLFASIDGRNISKKFHERVARFKALEENYRRVLSGGNFDLIVAAAKSIATAGVSLGLATNAASGLDDADRKMLVEIKGIAQLINNEIDSQPMLYKNESVEGLGFESPSWKESQYSYEEARVKLKAMMEEHERHDARHQKLLAENSKRIEGIEGKIESLESDVLEEVKNVKGVYDSAKEEFELKREEVNKLLGLVSGAAIAGSFEESAKNEKNMADVMRWASIICMGVIVVVVASSLWISLSHDFDWKESIFRVVLAILLSVPSAYLARESAKHRELHNMHLQTSLELRAINPYLASLPADEQHRIKAEVAGRIFGSKGLGEKPVDSYPVNMQEIIMEILKKVEIKGKQ